MQEDPQGGYVRWEDYEHVRQNWEEARKQIGRHEPILARTFLLRADGGLYCGFCDVLIEEASKPRKCCADGREEDERNK